MVTGKGKLVLLRLYFDYATIMKKILLLLISPRLSPCKYLLTSSYIYLLRSLDRCLQTISYLQKYEYLKNFLLQEFEWSLTWFTSSISSHKLQPTKDNWSKDLKISRSNDALLVLSRLKRTNKYIRNKKLQLKQLIRLWRP